MDEKKCILYIEDEPEHVMMVKMRLNAHGYDVKVAYNGKEGIEKAKKEKPDLILLDVILPEIDGLQVCRILKDDPVTKNIPVVVITASAVIALASRCKEVGADDYIRKPYDAKKLLEKIGNFVS